MNCTSCQDELEDFLYGELIERRAAEVRAHLAVCAECAEMQAQLQSEQELFGQFYEQTSFEPSGEMWAAIRERIEGQAEAAPLHKKQAGWLAGLMQHLSFNPALIRQAAFAAALVAVTVIVTTLWLQRSGNPQTTGDGLVAVKTTPTPASTASPQPEATPLIAQSAPPRPSTKTEKTGAPRPTLSQVAPKPAAPVSEEELLQRQIARAEREYQGAIRLLDRAIAKRRDTLDPAVIKQYEASLALIDNSIAQSRQTLRAQPDDAAARQFLLAAYARKVELMQDIAMR